MANSVDPDDMACYKPSLLDLHCLHRYWFWSARLKGNVIAPGQEANGNNLGTFSIFYKIMVCWVYSLESTHNIHFHNEMRKKYPKISLNICFLELLEEFPKDSKTSLNQDMVRKPLFGVPSQWRFTVLYKSQKTNKVRRELTSKCQVKEVKSSMWLLHLFI